MPQSLRALAGCAPFGNGIDPSGWYWERRKACRTKSISRHGSQICLSSTSDRMKLSQNTSKRSTHTFSVILAAVPKDWHVLIQTDPSPIQSPLPWALLSCNRLEKLTIPRQNVRTSPRTLTANNTYVILSKSRLLAGTITYQKSQIWFQLAP